MAHSARKLNFMIKNEVAEELESLIAPGQRSRLVNEAIVKELARFRRHAQTEKLMELRKKSPKLSTDEIVSAVRKDRERR
ncbi:MAG: hypothetical protein NDI77_16000 [Geobacteraceae bacterium]|nr:hypothetical protein [Geobacteraceae bacterium]